MKRFCFAPVMGLVFGAWALGCGSDSATDAKGACVNLCKKEVMCQPAVTLDCDTLCAGASKSAAGTSCSNAGDVISGYNKCAAVTCDQLTTCVATVPKCATSNAGSGGAGGAGGARSGGGGGGNTGTGGVSGINGLLDSGAVNGALDAGIVGGILDSGILGGILDSGSGLGIGGHSGAGGAIGTGGATGTGGTAGKDAGTGATADAAAGSPECLPCVKVDECTKMLTTTGAHGETDCEQQTGASRTAIANACQQLLTTYAGAGLCK